MPVPNTFANATSAIPLSQLDNNFATAITIGNTAVQLGNTVTTLNNMTLANVTISSVSTPVTVAQGGTGGTSLTAESVVVGNGTNAVKFVAPGTSGNILSSNGTSWVSQAPAAATGNVTIGNTTINLGGTATTVGNLTLTNTTISSVSTAITVAQGGTGLTTATAANNAIYSTGATTLTAGTLPVAAGGTGTTTLTSNNVLLGNATGAVKFVAPGTSGNVLSSNGAAWISQAPAAATGNITIGNTTIALGGTATTVGNLTLQNATISSLSTAVTVAQGGTGATTLTAENVMIGNGTSAVKFVAPGTSGNVLTSNGTAWASTAPAGGSGSWVYINTTTASGAGSADITGIGSTYDIYVINAIGVRSDSNADTLNLRVRIGGAYQSTANYFSHTSVGSSTATTYTSTTTNLNNPLAMTSNSIGSNAQYNLGFNLWIYNPAPSGRPKLMTWSGAGGQESLAIMIGGGNWYDGVGGALDGIRFIMSSGFIYGTFRLYGIKNS